MRWWCARCEDEVEAMHRQPRLRKWLKWYFVLPLPFVPVFPIMAADYAVMLPGIMVYLLGVGPVLGVLRDPACCDECGAYVERRT